MSGENEGAVSTPARVMVSVAIGFAMALLLCVVEPLRVAFANWDELSLGFS